jgi:hypothetical protein
MTVTKQPSGATHITTIVNNQLVQRSYFGYSTKEARAKFKSLVKETKNGN